MPELPEVETIKRDLLEKVIGNEIVNVYYTDFGRNLIFKSGQDLSESLPGKTLVSAGRRAKYLFINLSDGNKLVFHLKLTGRILVRAKEYPTDEFTKLILTLDDGREIRFTDRNNFAEVSLKAEQQEIDPKLGSEPFEAREQGFHLGLNKVRAETIKEALLDQSLLAGVGNIYADESLYLAGINPFKSPRSLSINEATKLLNAVKSALKEGIKHRGTTIDSFRDTEGRPGTHQFHLLVYGRNGKPCKKCAARIEYTEIKSRRTHFCPTCQPKDQLSLF